ncbi:MAG: DUF29 family protein [Xenococcus sp. MO_188.B8]|nr:DUF29 family protein [Xenococcus sp. MO_188.B8]
MEELLMIRQYIQEQRYDEALELVDELEEMSKEDKLNKIYSYAVILLLHLIKQTAENRSTRSWEFSIYNSTKKIKLTNNRSKSGGYYANEDELREILNDAFDTAIKRAALEAFEGQYKEDELILKIQPEEIKAQALSLINL